MSESSWHSDIAFDHAFILVRSLTGADERLRSEFGLGSVPGNTFPDHPGIENRFVPMRDGFIELLAADPRADGDAARFWTEQLERHGEHFAGWAMRTERIEDAARELGADIDAEKGFMETTGAELRWSVVWPFEDPPNVPFLIQWEDFASLRAHLDRSLIEANQEREPFGVEFLEIGGDFQPVETRIGRRSFVRAASGPDRVLSVVVSTSEGPLTVHW